MCLYGIMCMSKSVPEEASDSLELKLQVPMSCLTKITATTQIDKEV